jgi:DNA-directed RNA polymerase sigma subunit (sigma70/sigma32)
LRAPLAEEFLRGNLKQGDTLEVHAAGERLAFNELSELLEVLDNRERKIIFKRFGLDGGKPKTLEEVGKKFGVTRERIRRLQNIALVKLRRALAKREKPIVRRDPIQFLKPVSPDPTVRHEVWTSVLTSY